MNDLAQRLKTLVSALAESDTGPVVDELNQILHRYALLALKLGATPVPDLGTTSDQLSKLDAEWKVSLAAIDELTGSHVASKVPTFRLPTPAADTTVPSKP